MAFWTREVKRTPAVADACRVLLLVLGAHMDPTGLVSLKRCDLAAELGRSERRVAERLEQAVTVQFLTRMRRGQKGVTAVYRASLPVAQQDGPQHPERLSARRTTAPRDSAVKPFSRTPGGRASSKAVACEVLDVELRIKTKFEVEPTPAVGQR